MVKTKNYLLKFVIKSQLSVQKAVMLN